MCWDGGKREVEGDLSVTRNGFHMLFADKMIETIKEPFPAGRDHKANNIAFDPLPHGSNYRCEKDRRGLRPTCRNGLCCGVTTPKGAGEEMETCQFKSMRNVWITP